MAENLVFQFFRPSAGKLAFFFFIFVAMMILSTMISSYGPARALGLGFPPFYIPSITVSGIQIPVSFDPLSLLVNLAVAYLLAALFYEVSRQ